LVGLATCVRGHVDRATHGSQAPVLAGDAIVQFCSGGVGRRKKSEDRVAESQQARVVPSAPDNRALGNRRRSVKRSDPEEVLVDLGEERTRRARPSDRAFAQSAYSAPAHETATPKAAENDLC
jgi:hypothetical protein